MRFAGVSDIGRLRETNEDHWCVAPLADGAVLVAVADGMGGHRAGEVASRLAVQTLTAALESASGRDWRDVLVAAVEAAHARIREDALASEAMHGMGTTLTAAVVAGDRAWWVHVGDSRAYLLRDGDLRRLTEDHSVVAEMVREGRIDESTARHHPQRNLLTRALGMPDSLAADSGTLDLQPGDVLLLATDGLTALLAPEEIAALLDTAGADGDPHLAADRLVALANERGGADNVTVVIARAS